MDKEIRDAIEDALETMFSDKVMPSVIDDILCSLNNKDFVIVTKKTMEIYHEDQKEKEDMSCDNTM